MRDQIDEIEDVFISYKSDRSKDHPAPPKAREYAERLKKIFETGLAVKCFIDSSGIFAGEDFVNKIPAAIAKAKCVICLIDSYYENTPWCRFELTEAEAAKTAVILNIEKDFIPERHQTTNVDVFHDWNQKLNHPVLLKNMVRIGSLLDRKELSSLAEALCLPEDGRVKDILDWCRDNSLDEASGLHMRRIYKRELETRKEVNSARRSDINRQLTNEKARLSDQLAVEKKFLEDRETVLRNKEKIFYTDYEELIDEANIVGESRESIELKNAMDALREHERLGAEKDRAIKALNIELQEKNNDNSDLVKKSEALSAQLIQKSEQIDSLSTEVIDLEERLKRQAETEDGKKKSMLLRIRKQKRQCHDAFTEAEKLQRQALDFSKQAKALKTEITNQIEELKQQRTPNGIVIRYKQAGSNAPSKFIGIISQPQIADSSGVWEWWGHFDEKQNFSQEGVMKFRFKGRNVATFYGMLRGKNPDSELGGLLEYESTNPNLDIVRWEGSWPLNRTGTGVLSEKIGDFFGTISMPTLLQVHKDGHGVFLPNGRLVGEKLQFWERGKLKKTL